MYNHVYTCSSMDSLEVFVSVGKAGWAQYTILLLLLLLLLVLLLLLLLLLLLTVMLAGHPVLTYRV